jgi:type IV pilus assembly protein PilF
MRNRSGQSLVVGLLFAGVASGCIATGGDNIPDPQSVAIYDVANDEFRKGNLREALAKVNESLKVDSDNSDASHLGALIYLAFCARDTNSSDCRFDEAERLAKRAVSDNADNREAKNTLGVIYIHEKKYDDAIEVLKPLTADILYGSPQTSWGNLGWAYLQKGSHDEAIDALRRSVASQPAFCVGNYRLGLAYEKKGDVKAAREAFRRAVETERPGCKKIQEAWEARARVEARLGMTSDARTSLGECVGISRTTDSGARCDGALKSLPPPAAKADAAPAGAGKGS